MNMYIIFESQLVTKWLVTSWLLQYGYEVTSWVRVDLVTSRPGYYRAFFNQISHKSSIRYIQVCSNLKGYALPKVCLFVVFVPLDNFSLIWRYHHYQFRAANFDLSLALMAIQQWVFFSAPHVPWHCTSVYNGHYPF